MAAVAFPPADRRRKSRKAVLDGTLKQTSDLAGRTLMDRTDGSVVLVQGAGRAIVVTPAGTAGGVVALPSEAGTDLATDWNGHTWYVAMDGQGHVLIEVPRST
jgi:hypothetical protein